MAQFISTIRPAPGADGPFYTVTEQDNAVKNVTTGVQTIAAALDQCKSDVGSLLGGLSVTKVIIITDAS